MKQLKLSNGNATLVDDEYYDELSVFNWHENSAGYALRNATVGGVRKQILIHRQITDAPKGLVVDHIDGDPLNNTSDNLRVCRHRDNLRNQKLRKTSLTKYKGVTRYKNVSGEVWTSRITKNDHMLSLGTFDNPHDAARMYNFWALDMFGEFAHLNVITD